MQVPLKPDLAGTLIFLLKRTALALLWIEYGFKAEYDGNLT